MSNLDFIYAKLIKVDSGDSGIQNFYEYIKSAVPPSFGIIEDVQIKELNTVAIEPNVRFFFNPMLADDVFVSNDYIYKYLPFSEDFFSIEQRDIEPEDETKKPINVFGSALPIIHFVGKVVMNNCKIARRMNFIDSSIWHYAVTDTDTLNRAITKVKENDVYYKLLIAQESAELNKRMYQNSELVSLTMNASGHSQSIVPFKFHSEREMERKLNLIASDLKSSYLKHNNRIKWRILFVDDHAQSNMSVPEGTEDPHIKKIDIIKNRLEEISALFGKDVDDIFEFSEDICIASSIVDDNNGSASAIDMIKARRYDIIILDYLLGSEDAPDIEDDINRKICLWDQQLADQQDVQDCRIDYTIKEGMLNINIRWYGYMLLSYISNLIGAKSIHKGGQVSEEDRKQCELLAKELKAAKGICGKFWFMFSSGFASAVHDRLLTEGFSYSNRNWYIGRTACPTTTPELFKYNLLTMMKNQLDYITNVGLDYSSDNSNKVLNLTDLIYDIFKAESGSLSGEERIHSNVRKAAIDNFNDLLMMKARYALLKKDYYYNGEANGSPLVQSLFPDIKIYTEAFWEHIQHLIYLVAYGTIRQWPEMWEEYIFVREELMSAERKLNIIDKQSVIVMIEKYIINLKNAK